MIPLCPHAAAKVELITYRKSLSKEVPREIVRILEVSSGWIMTSSSETNDGVLPLAPTCTTSSLRKRLHASLFSSQMKEIFCLGKKIQASSSFVHLLEVTNKSTLW